ncbi:MAG TPA: hypothetical protein VGC14_05235 [Rhizobium sp.]
MSRYLDRHPLLLGSLPKADRELATKSGLSAPAPSTPFKLQLCQDIRGGVIGRRDTQRTYGVSANLIQLWLTQFDRGKLNDEEAEASVIAEYI